MSDIAAAHVQRRAGRHLSRNDAETLAALTVEMRRGLSSLAGRPFAPPILTGDTPADADRAFGELLEDTHFPLFARDIRTPAQAFAADAAIRSVPLTSLPIGLDLDPVSRDPFFLDPTRPDDRPGLGDWIPDIAPTAKDGSSIAQFSRLKRRALEVYETSLATGQHPNLTGALKSEPDHPIWAVGQFARFHAEDTGRTFGLDADTAAQLGVPLDRPLRLDKVALSWFWVGWTLDPALQNMSRDRLAKNGTYMSSLLWSAGPYPMHALYFAARRPFERRAVEPGMALQPDFAAFVNEEALAKHAPADPNFLRGCRNLLRMTCDILAHDLATGRKSLNPTGAIQQIQSLWMFVKPRDIQHENQRTAPKVDQAFRLLKGPAMRQIHPGINP